MHEMSLAENLRQVMEDQARQHGFQRVRTVWLAVSPFANVEPDSLAFCFDVVMRGSLAQGARLEIRQPPEEGWCLGCGARVMMTSRLDSCHNCGSEMLSAPAGSGVRITEMDVE